MKAITVQPHTTGSAKVEDVPDPDERLGGARRGGRHGRLRHRRRDHVRCVRLGAAGHDRLVLGHESLGRVLDPGTSGMSKGRPRRRHRAPPRSRAVPELRRR